MAFIGQRLPRKEDPRLLQGRGRFVADLQLPGMLHAALLRSQHAHARIAAVDTSAALASAGVAAVLTGADLADNVAPFPESFEVHPKKWLAAVKPYVKGPRARVLAQDKVHYVGEPVALVVARDRYAAEDALERIRVDYKLLPPVTDPWRALEPDAPVLHDGFTDNVVFRFAIDKGQPDQALAQAPHVLRERLHHHRCHGLPLEGRGVAATYDEPTDSLTVWSSTQMVYNVRRQISDMIGIPEGRVRVVAPDIGGGFGPKVPAYPEDVLIPFAARLLRRPVRWVEDRQESFTATSHARDQIHDVEVGFDDEGHILALVDRFVLDNGAYNPMGLTDAYNTAAHIQGPYKMPNVHVEAVCVATTKSPNAPYRGAGRPEAVFVTERVLDMIAQRLRLDPAEVRRRNMVPAEEMPFPAGVFYRDGEPVVYDSGDYPRLLRMALDAAGYDDIRRQQKQWSREGRHVGVGIACYVEGTGVGPHEGASVSVDSAGELVVATGAVPHGQGHHTVYSQIMADIWGVTPEQITLLAGDTSVIGYGTGTFASRSTVTVGAAAHHASARLMDKIRALAAPLLEIAPGDLVVSGGKVSVRGDPRRFLTLKQMAAAARPGWDHQRPPGVDPGLAETYYFEPPTVTWAAAVHVALVEVDTETGGIDILNYTVSHDAGRLVNPMLADAQVQGGVAQGIGGAIYEALVYDDTGQLLTGSLMDYLLPSAMQTPDVNLVHLEAASQLNPLGVKGLGEGGAIAPPAALANAVVDALRDRGVNVTVTLLSPSNIQELLSRGRV